METRIRSASKSIVWRVIGVFILAIVTFFYTRNWIQVSWITFLHHGIFLCIYFYHERFWIWIGNRIRGKKRYILKTILYEIILGQGILGLISYIVTGNLQCATKITITYIFIKVWIYIIHDRIWEKIRWGIKKDQKKSS